MAAWHHFGRRRRRSRRRRSSSSSSSSSRSDSSENMISLTHVIAVQAITYVVSQAAGKFGWKPYTRAVVLTSAIAVMSLYTLSDHFVEVSHNYYNVLGVDRSVSDVRAAYKRVIAPR